MTFDGQSIFNLGIAACDYDPTPAADLRLAAQKSQTWGQRLLEKFFAAISLHGLGLDNSVSLTKPSGVMVMTMRIV